MDDHIIDKAIKSVAGREGESLGYDDAFSTEHWYEKFGANLFMWNHDSWGSEK